MTRVLLLVVLAITLLAAACGQGAEEGRTLRVQASPGDAVSLRMHMDMGMEITMDGERAPSFQLPVVAMTTDMEIAEVTQDAIRMTYGYRDVELTGGQDEARNAMQQAMATMDGITGSVTLSHRGEVLDSSVDLPGTLDPTLTSMMEQLEQQMSQFAVPFPPEGIVEGESWSHSATLEVSGITTTNDATYTLRSLDGDDYTIDVELTQTLEPGPITGPDGQVVGEVLEGTTTGTGSFEGSLGFPVPTRGSMSSSGTNRMRVTGGAQQLEMVQEMSLEMRYQPVG